MQDTKDIKIVCNSVNSIIKKNILTNRLEVDIDSVDLRELASEVGKEIIPHLMIGVGFHAT